MTERIKVLLDDAVSALEPASPDPIALILGRGRAARRRAAVTGALAAILLLGGLAAGGLAIGRTGRAPAVEMATDPLPTPYVEGDQLVAGALRLPIPAGWQVVHADVKAPCGALTRTILIVGADRGCRNAPIELTPTANLSPEGVLLSRPGIADPAGQILSSPVSITLRGGEPAWLLDGLDAADLKPRPGAGYNYYNVVLLPWSKLNLQLRVDGPAEKQILDSISTEPTGSGPLALPASATSVELTTPDAAGHNTAAGHARSTNPAVAAAVIRRLAGQTAVVDDADACASAGQPAARLTLEGSETTTVIITLGGQCQEAVSSDGGRVRLTDATVRQLKHLLGIGAE
jgi:hypothetical protein